MDPNAYTIAEKIAWLNELEGAVRKEIKKVYSTATLTAKESVTTVTLPPGVHYEDIRYVYRNGKEVLKAQMTGSDRYLHAGLVKGDELMIVYLTHHDPIRYVETEKEVIAQGDRLSGTFSDLPLCPGDYLELSGIAGAGIYQIDTLDDTTIVLFDADFAEGTAGTATIRRVLCDPPEIHPPYDQAYVEYLLCKISYFGRDYESYQNHAAQYNSTMDAYRRFMAAHQPRIPEARLKHVW